jgi:hypothetical protein
MKHNNDVYFITLIDLLVQIVFLGLLLFVVAKAGEAERDAEPKVDQGAVERLLKATGVSNLTELTDELSKLAPIKELKGTADFIQRAGGPAAANQLVEAAQRAGGAQQVQATIQEGEVVRKLVDQAGGVEKLAAIVKKAEEGSGKPPCLYTTDGGKKTVKPLATVIADNTDIAFEETTPDLEQVLALLGTSFSSVQKVSFATFSTAFSAITRLKPECRYTLRLVERTNLVHARDAAGKVFYLSIIKPKPQNSVPGGAN